MTKNFITEEDLSRLGEPTFTKTSDDKFEVAGDDESVSGIDVLAKRTDVLRSMKLDEEYFNGRTGKKHICSRCKNQEHNHNDPKDPSKSIITRCLGKDCECPCQYSYIGRDGRRRSLKDDDDSFIDSETLSKQNSEVDRLIMEWRKLENEHTIIRKE